MSNKNKLSYEAQEPAFLRRLRAGQSELDGRSNVQIARPQKSRLKTSADDKDEDEPLIVDESGEVVAKSDWEGRLKAETEASTEPDENADLERAEHEAGKTKEQKVAGIGGQKKRKAVKAIAIEDTQEMEDQDDERKEPIKSMSEATASLRSVVKGSTDAAKKDSEPIPTASKKKKVKKIKLSFDEPD